MSVHPTEIGGLAVDRDGADGAALLSWRAAPIRADVGSRYDVLRSPVPYDFDGSASRLVSRTTGLETVDTAVPDPGGAYYYLVRGSYDYPRGEGPLGFDSDGQPRFGRNCP